MPCRLTLCALWLVQICSSQLTYWVDDSCNGLLEDRVMSETIEMAQLTYNGLTQPSPPRHFLDMVRCILRTGYSDPIIHNNINGKFLRPHLVYKAPKPT